jgi:hypothetical protein
MGRRLSFKGCGAHTILLIGVLACLCFSSGEGLRLMPISDSSTREAGPTNFRATIASLNFPLSYQYATYGLEKSRQKRVQRQQLRDGLAISRNIIDHLPLPVQLTAGIELTPYSSLFLVSQPPSRAPPLA